MLVSIIPSSHIEEVTARLAGDKPVFHMNVEKPNAPCKIVVELLVNEDEAIILSETVEVLEYAPYALDCTRKRFSSVRNTM